MTFSTNGTAAREPIVRASHEASPNPARRITGRRGGFWSATCFVIFLLAVFGQPFLELANYAA